jgi:hypothetical protein
MGDEEEFEDTKRVIKIRISKNRQHNGQKKKVQKDKQRSTKHTYKTKDRVTRNPLKTGDELRCPRRVSSLICGVSIYHEINVLCNAFFSVNFHLSMIKSEYNNIT